MAGPSVSNLRMSFPVNQNILVNELPYLYGVTCVVSASNIFESLADIGLLVPDHSWALNCLFGPLAEVVSCTCT
jgi:hypothetical protein